MSRLILPPGVRESVESVDGGGYGAAALDQRQRLPTGSACFCGSAMPWPIIKQTMEAPGMEHEIQCARCNRTFAVMNGCVWPD